MTDPVVPVPGRRDPVPDLRASLDRMEDPAFAALYAVLDELDAYVKDARWEGRPISAVQLDRVLAELRTRYLPQS